MLSDVVRKADFSCTCVAVQTRSKLLVSSSHDANSSGRSRLIVPVSQKMSIKLIIRHVDIGMGIGREDACSSDLNDMKFFQSSLHSRISARLGGPPQCELVYLCARYVTTPISDEYSVLSSSSSCLRLCGSEERFEYIVCGRTERGERNHDEPACASRACCSHNVHDILNN
jgi:hypothetical protein